VDLRRKGFLRSRVRRECGVVATAMTRTMDSPRPWWSSMRAVESLERLEEEVDLLRRDHRPVSTMAWSPATR
jgi:hypothetical protein